MESNPAIGSDSGGESVPDSGPVQELGPVRIEFRLGLDSGIGLGPELGPVRLLRFSFRPQQVALSSIHLAGTQSGL